ncbi:MAG TPA: TorF family putative porin [Ramlibacter sp.]|nr:TorF family putative porin [Ramlibacter sp.]
MRHRTPASRTVALACAACALLLVARGAIAQASASITLESDYRFRGVSLGDSRPSARAEIGYDADHGWYAGGAIARAQFPGGDRYTQLALYGGRVFPLTSALNLDTGASLWRFTGGGYDFAEAYAGLVAREWNVRLNYSPNYFHEGVKTLYLEAAARRLITDDWRVFAHVGELVRVSPPGPVDPSDYDNGSGAVPRRARWDVRTGIGWTARENLDLQLAWTRASRGGPVPTTTRGGRAGWIASAAFSF